MPIDIDTALAVLKTTTSEVAAAISTTWSQT
jgi:hypothetical protein